MNNDFRDIYAAFQDELKQMLDNFPNSTALFRN